jgi:hypothetical protein
VNEPNTVQSFAFQPRSAMTAKTYIEAVSAHENTSISCRRITLFGLVVNNPLKSEGRL